MSFSSGSEYATETIASYCSSEQEIREDVVEVNKAARMEGKAAAVGHQAERVQYESSHPLGYAFVLLSTATFGRHGNLPWCC